MYGKNVGFITVVNKEQNGCLLYNSIIPSLCFHSIYVGQ